MQFKEPWALSIRPPHSHEQPRLRESCRRFSGRAQSQKARAPAAHSYVVVAMALRLRSTYSWSFPHLRECEDGLPTKVREHFSTFDDRLACEPLMITKLSSSGRRAPAVALSVLPILCTLANWGSARIRYRFCWRSHATNLGHVENGRSNTSPVADCG